MLWLVRKSMVAKFLEEVYKYSSDATSIFNTLNIFSIFISIANIMMIILILISKTPTGRAPPPPKFWNSEVCAVARDFLGAARELLGGSWVPPEGLYASWEPLGRLLGGSWEALGGFQEAA